MPDKEALRGSLWLFSCLNPQHSQKRMKRVKYKHIRELLSIRLMMIAKIVTTYRTLL